MNRKATQQTQQTLTNIEDQTRDDASQRVVKISQPMPVEIAMSKMPYDKCVPNVYALKTMFFSELFL